MDVRGSVCGVAFGSWRSGSFLAGGDGITVLAVNWRIPAIR
jgi:hypothetical protein